MVLNPLVWIHFYKTVDNGKMTGIFNGPAELPRWPRKPLLVNSMSFDQGLSRELQWQIMGKF
jgi:hypothetical protein